MVGTDLTPDVFPHPIDNPLILSTHVIPGCLHCIWDFDIDRPLPPPGRITLTMIWRWVLSFHPDDLGRATEEGANITLRIRLPLMVKF